MIRRRLLPGLLALACLAACAPAPALAPAAPRLPAAATKVHVLDAGQGGHATARAALRPAAARRLQSELSALSTADIDRVEVYLEREDDTTPGQYNAVEDGFGYPLFVALADPFEEPVAVTNLKAETNYRLRTVAYDEADVVVSKDAASSWADFRIDLDQTSVAVTLKVGLADREVTVDLDGRQTVLDDTYAATDAAACYGGGGERLTLVAWSDDRLGAGDEQIYGRFYDPDSRSPYGPEFLISDGGTGSNVQPAIAFDPDQGRWLVAWNGPGATILAAAVDSFGTVDPPSTLVISAFDKTRPAVAYDADAGSFAVVWQEATLSGGTDLMVQTITSAGALGNALSLGGASNAAGDDWLDPAIVAQGDANRLTVAYSDQTVGSGAIVLQNLELSGGDAQLDGGRVVLTHPGPQRRPALAFSPDTSGLLVAWEDGRNAGTSDTDIYVLPVTGALTIGTAATQLLSTVAPQEIAGEQLRPQLAYNAEAKEWLATYLDTDTFANGEVFIKRLAADLTPIGERIALADGFSTGSRTGPRVAYAGAPDLNSLFAFWNEDGNVYARFVDSLMADTL